MLQVVNLCLTEEYEGEGDQVDCELELQELPNAVVHAATPPIIEKGKIASRKGTHE